MDGWEIDNHEERWGSENGKCNIIFLFSVSFRREGQESDRQERFFSSRNNIGLFLCAFLLTLILFLLADRARGSGVLKKDF